ncbi:MAG: hypothetical protein IGS03_17055 [Candidatus Sericytochromatia bacterium]|nr:hypothetical protein [Candidatus Sericytochromatia bacterium]
MGFEATVRSGPSQGTQLTGLLTFKTLANGQLENAKLISATGETIAVDGQIVNGRASLNFRLADGGVVAGTGEFENRQNLCAGTLTGPLTGPQPGDSGDWLGDADGTAPVPDMPGTIAYSVTVTNQVFILDTTTNTSTQIAGLSESATDTLLNGPTGVVYIERQLNNRDTSAARDNTDGLWISDTGNQRVLQYKYNATNQTWEKSSQQINLSTLQTLYPEASQFTPRGLTEYNYTNALGNIRTLLIADQHNHHVFSFSGEGFPGRAPRPIAFLGRFNYSLDNAANALGSRTPLPGNTQILRLFRSAVNTDFAAPIFGDIEMPVYSGRGLLKSPVSLLPKRVVHRVNGLSISSADNCTQSFANIPGIQARSTLNQSTATFPEPAALSRPTDHHLLTGVGRNQAPGCYSVENTLIAAQNTVSESPTPTPTPTPVPTPTQAPVPTPTPTVPSGPSLTLSHTEVQMLPGEALNLTARAFDAKGNPSENMSWTSSDAKIVRLSAKGSQASIEALAEGRLEIAVDFPEANLRAFIVVTVRAEKATEK